MHEAQDKSKLEDLQNQVSRLLILGPHGLNLRSTGLINFSGRGMTGCEMN
jgi:hypothetical protein